MLRGQVSLDWHSLVPGTTHNLALAKDGAGRMYYRVGITYAPKDTHLPALDAGFVVRRTYSVVDVLVDVSKLADGRYEGGLHQAIEVKEGVPCTSDKENLARLSFQRFFRLYGKLGGMTGTA